MHLIFFLHSLNLNLKKKKVLIKFFQVKIFNKNLEREKI
jgi:hypothetical protein